jgi:hypothetical protein
MTPAKVRLAMAAMGKPETNVAALRVELGVSRQTLYRHVSPDGRLRSRRLVVDYERKVQTSEALIQVAMLRLLLARLGRSR